MQTIKLLIVDDHKNAREALAQLLSDEQDIEVHDVPASDTEALATAMTLSPNVILLDTKIKSGDCISICQNLLENCPDLRILTLDSTASEEVFESLERIGVSEHLFKDLKIDELLKVIRLNP